MVMKLTNQKMVGLTRLMKTEFHFENRYPIGCDYSLETNQIAAIVIRLAS